MRISDDRYSRDRLRLDVALQFIRHEARTRTIREWTGLSGDRVRKLYREYLGSGGQRLPRHRGKSPRQCAWFMRSSRLRHEASTFAAICSLLGLLGRRAPGAPGALADGAALCQAYDAYLSLVSRPAIGFEHAVLLLEALSRGDELRCRRCHGCGGLTVVEAYALPDSLCSGCAAPPR